MSAEDVRAKVSAVIPDTKEQMVTHLFDWVNELKQLGVSSEVDTPADLIPVLAANMAGPGADPLPKMAAAKLQIEGNHTTALTLSDDRYVGLKNGSKFDELHELIHICSAKGGESGLHHWKLQMNEGAINVFAVLTAPKAGVTVDARYTDETEIVNKLLKLITVYAGKENEAYKALYGMTFCGKNAGAHRKTFFNLVGEAYVAIPIKDQLQVRPNGTSKSFSEKKWSSDDAASAFEGEVQKWTLGWLRDRLPA